MIIAKPKVLGYILGRDVFDLDYLSDQHVRVSRAESFYGNISAAPKVASCNPKAGDTTITGAVGKRGVLMMSQEHGFGIRCYGRNGNPALPRACRWPKCDVPKMEGGFSSKRVKTPLVRMSLPPSLGKFVLEPRSSKSIRRGVLLSLGKSFPKCQIAVPSLSWTNGKAHLRFEKTIRDLADQMLKAMVRDAEASLEDAAVAHLRVDLDWYPGREEIPRYDARKVNALAASAIARVMLVCGKRVMYIATNAKAQLQNIKYV